MESSRAGPRLRLLKRPADRAFDELYRRHAGDVYKYALAVLANPTDAEDVTQTTFLNAYRAFQRGERPLKPHNWLIAIAHNVCRMRWRQAGSRPREVALDEAPEPVAPENDSPNLDEVLTALAALSFNQRAALVMRELEGRTYQEMAEVLGISVSAVEALLFRARRRLQINRKSLGVITSVPLPGSLTSFLGGSGGVVAAGGTAVGANLVLKAAALVAASAATAGVGYKGIDILNSSYRTTAPQGYVQAAQRQQQPAANAAAPSASERAARGTQPRRALPADGTTTRPDRQAPASTPGSVPTQLPATAATPAPATAATPSATAPATSAAAPSAASPVQLPSVPLPTLPSSPVPVPTPTVPQLPVTVPTPRLPPPPQLPPAPPLPPTPSLPPAPPLPPLPPILPK